MSNNPYLDKHMAEQDRLLREEAARAALAAAAATQAERDKEKETVKQDRQKDLEEGRKRGEQLFADGSLGRIDQNRSQEIADIVARRKANINGFNPEELNALRTNHQVEANQALATALRNQKILQAQSGVRGGLASAQQSQLLKDSNAARIANERELFLKNAEAGRQGLNAYESTINGSRKDELERAMFNLAQGNKEKLGRLGTEFGYGTLGSGDRSSLFQKWASQDMAEATRAAAKQGGGLSWLCTEASKARAFDAEDKKALSDLLKASLKFSKKSVCFYLLKCGGLVSKMQEAGFNWGQNSKVIDEIIELSKQKKFRKAFDLYVVYVSNLMTIFWPEFKFEALGEIADKDLNHLVDSIPLLKAGS